MVAQSFHLFLLARVIGGLSEGNVQLSMAIITDVTDSASRSRSMVSIATVCYLMDDPWSLTSPTTILFPFPPSPLFLSLPLLMPKAMVGIAFAVAFTTGPALGAYMASIDLRDVFPWMVEWGLNPYSAPAMASLFLVCIEALYLYLYLPETLPAKSPQHKSKRAQRRRRSLSHFITLRRIHVAYFTFLLLFSGMEFTLTFLTFDTHGFTHGQQGALLCYMGILSALLQGGYVRRVVGKKVGERSLALQGICSCALGLLTLALSASPSLGGPRWLWVGVTGVSIASATVVNSLNSLASASASLSPTEEPSLHERDGGTGEILGKIRSTGQLGRAFGPLLACGLYWWLGPMVCYTLGACMMILVGRYVYQYLPKRVDLKHQ